MSRRLALVAVLLAHTGMAYAQPAGVAPTPPQSNEACPPVKPIQPPQALGVAVPAQEDKKLPGNIGCAPGNTPNASTATPPGAGVMVTSPTGMMTNPGLQPMPNTEAKP
jgi:hypothetical protein